MRVAFFTLGCKVNQYETNAIEEQFVSHGFEVTHYDDEADIYVINSCTVTGESDKKTRQILRRFRRQNPVAVIALCGCFPQAFPDAAEELPEADVILGASNKNQVLSAVKSRLAGGQRVIQIENYKKGEEFERTQVASFGPRTRAFIKIQDGCERYCAYCIIPKARGPVRSKSLEDLKEEVENLVESGYKEIVLVGINLSCYGQDFGKHLIDAVETAASVNGLHRVRLGSLEPELLDKESIGILAKEEKFCPQFHLSLQSGSDGTLKRMRRHYDAEEYRRIVKDLRDALPNCAITTDVMVGFPGETEVEHEESMNFVKEIGIARAHVFAYSQRPGTVADLMDEQVNGGVKSKRSREMIAVTDETRRLFLENQIGTIQKVLFETETNGRWEGYTPNYTQVFVESDEDLTGQIRSVKLRTVDKDHCLGDLV